MEEYSSLSKILNDISQDFGLYDQVWKQQKSIFNQFTEQLNEQLSFVNNINLAIQIPDIYSAIPKIDTSALVSALDVYSEISKSLLDTTWQDTLAQQLREFTYGLDTVTQRISIDFSAFRLAWESISALDVFGDLIHLVQFDQDVMAAFKAAGWPIAPSMPRELRERVVEFYKLGKARYVSRTIMGYYHRSDYENLASVIDSWRNCSLFIPRMHIFEDAFDAHRNGKYTLSVPALLPQIEGILSDYVHSNELPARCGKIQQVYNAAIGDLDSYSLASWAIANTLLYQLQTNTYVFTDFDAELKKSVNNRQTTRHTVLHGVTINYHKPIHSLKAFVLLDAISALETLNGNHA